MLETRCFNIYDVIMETLNKVTDENAYDEVVTIENDVQDERPIALQIRAQRPEMEVWVVWSRWKPKER